MTKNLNLKVDESLFYEFHRLKGLLRAGTNQDCLRKLLQISDEKMKDFEFKADRDEYLKTLDRQHILISEKA